MFADVRLKWDVSLSNDIASRSVSVAVDGQEPTVSIVTADVAELVLKVDANSSVIFSTEVTDKEGKKVSSESFAFTIGDLVDPLPDTNLGFDIIGTHEGFTFN